MGASVFLCAVRRVPVGSGSAVGSLAGEVSASSSDAQKSRLLLDMDPGIDDAIALLLAMLTPGVEIVGIGTSWGNEGELQSALNAARVLNEVGALGDIPICVGQTGP